MGTDVDQMLVDQIGQGKAKAWEDLIERYEGRLLAFVESRLRNRTVSEDIVQETFIGFLNSLPNYDRQRPLESYLFSICAYKLTDHLRREGRRPVISLDQPVNDSHGAAPWQIVSGRVRVASTIARSAERQQLEEQSLVEALQNQIEKWQQRGDWTKLKCIELLFVAGVSNKDAAEVLGISEQQVANFKFDFLARTRALIGRQNLNAEVFPELAQDSEA
ncbi:MAG: sigma-70 family RNA polymerase sigma factor [Planctomycetales bacterium]|nr:sigma-70 family RNA polymerase sigma factor [Planctomycetales bacterium]